MTTLHDDYRLSVFCWIAHEHGDAYPPVTHTHTHTLIPPNRYHRYTHTHTHTHRYMEWQCAAFYFNDRWSGTVKHGKIPLDIPRPTQKSSSDSLPSLFCSSLSFLNCMLFLPSFSLSQVDTNDIYVCHWSLSCRQSSRFIVYVFLSVFVNKRTRRTTFWRAGLSGKTWHCTSLGCQQYTCQL